MCGRYTLRVAGDELSDRFGVGSGNVSFEPTYNAAPGQELPVVRKEEEREIAFPRWGLVPSWADDDHGGHINARAETVSEKPSFSEAYESRRCVVPSDGFYEWTDGTPWYVEFDRIVGLAGVWERRVPETRQTGLGDFDDGSREVKETFAILTTEPNEQVARLHDRMAAVLAPDEEEEWLDGSLTSEELGPRDEPAEVRMVSERVNSPSNDDPSLVKCTEEG